MKNPPDLGPAFALAEQIRPLLKGHPPEIQGAALCDLAAIYLAGHTIADEPEKTMKARNAILAAMVETIRLLVPYMEGIHVKPQVERFYEQRGGAG